MMNELALEKLIFQYINALEQGDFDVVTAILEQAEHDPELEEMILETNDALVVEDDISFFQETERVVQQIIQEHLPSGLRSNDELIDIPPLMVGDVVGRIQSDADAQLQIRNEAKSINQYVRQLELQIPEKLNYRSIQALFDEIGISVTKRFQRLFHETAVLLSMRREQNVAQLAATRRRREYRKSNSNKPGGDE